MKTTYTKAADCFDTPQAQSPKRLFALHVPHELTPDDKQSLGDSIIQSFRQAGHDWELLIIDRGYQLTELTDGDGFDEATLE